MGTLAHPARGGEEEKLATYNEALDLYQHTVELMADAIDRLDEIAALPKWQRWFYGWERRRIEQDCYTLDRQLALLQTRMEASQ